MIRQLHIKFIAFSILSLGLIANHVQAADMPEFRLVLENHLFFPSKLEVPANTKFKLIIENHDASLEEFDSFDMNREKVIFPGKKAVIFVGPLVSGHYEFFGEYNRDSATGVLIAGNKKTLNKKENESDVN